MYTTVPTNGKISEAMAQQPTISGSAMRRRASAKVQYTSASHTTTRKTPRSLMAVFRPSLLIPKTPTGSMVPGTLVDQSAVSTRAGAAPPARSQEKAPEAVSQPEEDEDHERHDDRHEGDHRGHRRTVVVHSRDLPRAPSGRSRSAIR